jgi:hypothetical protein
MLSKKHIIAGLVLSLTSISSAGFAMETDQAVYTSKVEQNYIQAASKEVRTLKTDYMKETYRDVKFDLIGPLKFSIDDHYVERRFTNVDTSRAERVRNPYQTNEFSNSTYYRATVAKAGFKFKF